MAEQTENTLTAYLGPEFQQKLIWQLLVEPEFAEKTAPILAVEYFDDPNFKRLFLIMLEHIKEYGKVPNLQNQSIVQAINEFKTPGNQIEEESLFAVIERIKLWNERVLNQTLMNDGDVVQKATNTFIKQQEYRKFAEGVLIKCKNGEIKSKHSITEIEEKLQKIGLIGIEEDNGTDATEGLEKALRKEFRKTIPTGVAVIDSLTGGGLGKGEMGLILSPSGAGKAQPLSSKILTPNGWIKMGEVKINDLVIGSNGKPQKVLGIYPQGKRPIYKINFSDNTSVLCDREHIWSVNTIKQRTDKHKLGGVTYYSPDNSFIELTVSEMLDDYILKDRNKRIYNYRLPNISPVEFIEREIKIHPYVMGILLGDGCLAKNNQPHITTTDKFIVDKINELYKKTKVFEFQGRKENYLNIYKIMLLDSKLYLDKELHLYGKLSFEKEIPINYLYNSLENRIFLLQGLIDSDGTVGKNGSIIYSTTSPKLSDDVRELVLSLGGCCRTTKKKKQYSKNNEKVYGRESYSITISFPEAANIQSCLLPRKLERIKNRTKYSYNKFISNISYSHDEEAQCIYVENDDHLYVTDDYVLTHNTTLLTKFANTARENDYNVLQIVFEDTMEQIKRKHVTIWSKIPLSQLDENNELAFQKANDHINKLGPGKLTIKKFSQEDTTMKDIRNWITREQKRHNFKYDIIILDYLDCLESHKKSADRTEAELVIVKSFEAMASDFDVPCWSAIQGGRSSFGAELVEAHQTGGSIKRIQKAHFFMSIAKTADQQEASLASIRIIKARFCKDGQTFKDCIFNNDTLEIIIKDDRYVGGGAYANKKKYADDVMAEQIEKHARGGGYGMVHAIASTAMPESPEDSLLGDMRDKFMENNNIVEANTVTDTVVNTKINTVIDTNVDTVIDTKIIKEKDIDILTIDDIPIEGVDLNKQNVLNDINNYINEPLLEWSGETFTSATNEIEVKYEDVKPKFEEIKPEIIPKVEETIPKIVYNPEKNNIIKEKFNISEVEKKMNIDPDGPTVSQKNLFDFIAKQRISEIIKKKE